MNVENVQTALQMFTDRINQKKDYLSDLDREIGDGDHGVNMARGTTAMIEAINAKKPSNLADVFKIGGMALISRVGGASGPLYGSAFIGMSKAATTSSEAKDIISAGLEAIKQRGKAEVGEKTMVDVWEPVSQLLIKGSFSEEQLDSFVEETAAIKATKGRASYLGDRSIGHLDPGAVSSGYFFNALAESGCFDE